MIGDLPWFRRFCETLYNTSRSLDYLAICTGALSSERAMFVSGIVDAALPDRLGSGEVLGGCGRGVATCAMCSSYLSNVVGNEALLCYQQC